ncbi:DUF814 domain-containing protein [Candidatus Woesearchaeota archaeon]|nr:DUF814 domain-containing protein [Candidatus Woesearchaeota archaeon]
MPLITLDVRKSLEENASLYYEKAKKLKKKKEGALKAIADAKKKLAKLEKEAAVEHQQQEDKKQSISAGKKEWYEKFRWFVSSAGFLVVGGRDATTNEIIIKKHAGKDDIVFHTDIAGSPFFVVKADGKKIDEQSIKEAASATAAFSKAWKLGMGNTPVFWVLPGQVSKKAQAGEFLAKGAFMIYGKKNYVDNEVACAIGNFNGKMMAGPLSAVKKRCEKLVEVEQGREKSSDIAKRIQHKIGGSLDEIIRALPSGGCRIKAK